MLNVEVIPIRRTKETSMMIDNPCRTQSISRCFCAPSLSWLTHCPAIILLNMHAQLVTGRIERVLRRDTIVPRTDITHTHVKKARMMLHAFV